MRIAATTRVLANRAVSAGGTVPCSNSRATTVALDELLLFGDSIENDESARR
jgi:hypothetical protein